MLKRQMRFLNGIYDFLGLLFMAGLILCCWLQVAARFINSVTIVWTDELAGYMMVGCCFFGAGTAMRHGGHLGAYFLRDRLKGKMCGLALLFNALITMAVLIMFVIGGLKELELVGGNMATSMPWLSQKWLYIPLIIGSVYMFFYTLRDAAIAVRIIRTGNVEGFRTGLSSPFPSEVNEC